MRGLDIAREFDYHTIHMKNFISFFIGVFALTVMVAPWSAGAIYHNKKTPEARQERKGEMKDNAKENVQEKRTQLKEGLKDRLDDIKEKVRGGFEKKRQEFTDGAKDRKAILQKKLGEKRGERIEQFFTKMTEKFDSALERLEKTADKIEGRLTKAAENGRDVVALRAKLTEARAKIEEARTFLEDAKAKYSDAAKNADFKAAFRNVKEVVQSVSGKIKEAHRALVEVITSMKGLGKGQVTPPPAEGSAAPTPAPASGGTAQ